MTATARRPIHAIPTAVLASLLLVACAPVSPEPSASPSTAPEPSATPVDVVAAFVAIVADDSFAGSAQGTRELRLGDSIGTYAVEVEFLGSRIHAVTTLEVGGAARITEAIAVGGTTYAKQGDQPWIIQEGEIVTMLPDLLRGLPPLVDEGVEEVDGRDLHHLVPAAPLRGLAELLGVSGTTSNLTGTLDLYVTEVGAPVILRVTASFRHLADGGPIAAEMTEEWAISLGARPLIERPEEPWRTYASTRFPFSIALPAPWTVHTDETAYDLIWDESWTVNGCVRAVGISYIPAVSSPADPWFAGVEAQLSEVAAIESSETAETAGMSGFLYELHSNSVQCGRQHVLWASFHAGTTAWDITLFAPASQEARDRELLEWLLVTFAVTDAPAAAEPGDTVALASLPVGACFDPAADLDLLGFIWFGGPDAKSTVVWTGARQAVLRDCAGPHLYEVFAIFPASATALDCVDPFEEYVGKAWQDSELNVVRMDDFTPGSDLPHVCSLFLATDAGFGIGALPVTGSLKDSSR